MNIIDEYLNKIHDQLYQGDSVYPHPVQTPKPSYVEDTPPLCQKGMKWNPQLQRCVQLGDGENIDYTGE